MRFNCLGPTARYRRSSGRWFLVLWFLLWPDSRLLAHTTPEMNQVRFVLLRWANALLNEEVEEMESLLHDDFQVNQVQSKENYLQALTRNRGRQPDMRIILRHAYFEPVDGDIRVSPVVLSRSRGAFRGVVSLLFRRSGEEWKIVRMDYGGELPEAMTAGDLPDKHSLIPVPVRLRDAETGHPLHARVHVRDSQGEYWPPQGHQKNIPKAWREDVGGDVHVEDKTFAYVRPDFILPLVEGRYTVEVRRGIEYEPARAEFEVTAGRIPDLEIRLRRWSHMQRENWYSGDTHVHFLDPLTAVLEARGEDLNVVNVLATKWGELITDVERFLGKPDPASDPEHVVYVNEESRHDFLGHTVLLNLKRLVYPLSWGGPGAGVPGGLDYPAMAHQADETHRQGGLVSWAHFPYPGGELPVDVALGKIDSVDVLTWRDALSPVGQRPGSAEVFYRFLNCGLRIAATAGTDKMFNTQVVGIPRTYVKVDGEFSYQGWIDGIRSGRTFVTTGPMLRFTVQDRPVGETVRTRKGERLSVRAEVHSYLPVEKIEVVQQGKVIASRDNPEKKTRVVLETAVPVQQSSWLAARAYSSQKLPYQSGIPVLAHTSPVYLEVDEAPLRSPEDAAFFVKWIEESLEWLWSRANIPEEEQRQEMIDLFERARQVYLKQMESR